MTDSPDMPPAPLRKIIHVDMDAFYASVEQRDEPAYRGRPIAVGGGGRRGVVAAASYEARVFGVHSAMPGALARRLCPDLVFVRPRFAAYKEASAQIRAVFHRYTDLVEPLSLDEAYLDVTVPKEGPPSGTLLARAIKDEIRAATGLTASAGVSYNKFLAKLASDLDKPDGLAVIRPEEAEAFVASLPVGRFHGVGPATVARMEALAIYTGADLRARSERELTAHFGKAGRHFYRIARGVDDRPVRPDRERKSIGAEQTFEHDVRTADAMRDRLRPLAEKVAGRMQQLGVGGRTVTLKIKYSNFQLHTRSTTLQQEVTTAAELMATVELLLHAPEVPPRPVRLLGVSVATLCPLGAEGYPRQLHFDFPEPA